jgi:UDP-3-O-[3-hydroxymyristoyl] glucosamine N-acyltransferase
MVLRSNDLVERYGCVLRGGPFDDVRDFVGLAPLSHATAETIAFLSNDKYLDEAVVTRAGALLCTAAHADALAARAGERAEKLGTLAAPAPQLFVTAEPYVVFARLAQLFFKPVHPWEGHSPQAHVDASATVDPSAVLFPFCFVGPGARVGARSVVYTGVFVGAGSVVGDDCILYPNAVVREGCRLGDRCILNPGAVVGGDGFGFAPSGMENVKIPQVGGVRIEDDVELGANACVDRGAMADTFVGRQTKIDSLVIVAHNVRIGQACFIAAQTGIAGSAALGDRVTLAGQVGVAGHVKVGAHVTVLAQAGVAKDLPTPGVYNGTPARPSRELLRQTAALNRLVGTRKGTWRPGND